MQSNLVMTDLEAAEHYGFTAQQEHRAIEPNQDNEFLTWISTNTTSNEALKDAWFKGWVKGRSDDEFLESFSEYLYI